MNVYFSNSFLSLLKRSLILRYACWMAMGVGLGRTSGQNLGRWVQVQRDGALAESFPVGLEPQVEAYASFETPFDKRGSQMLTLSHLLHHFL